MIVPDLSFVGRILSDDLAAAESTARADFLHFPMVR